MVNQFYAENLRNDRVSLYSEEKNIKSGTVVNLFGEIYATITVPKGGIVPVTKGIGTDTPVFTKVPFVMGFINDTMCLCNVILKSDTKVYEEDPVIVIDVPTSKNTVEHYLLIGYKSLDDIAESLLDVLGLDIESTSLKTNLTNLQNVESWIVENKDTHDKPFSGLLPKEDTTHYGVGIEKGNVPISYNFVNNRKVYKACVLGTIEPMNDSWRTLCDTLTFMSEKDVLILYISSEGGDTQTASSFIAAASLSKGTLVTVACGSCASAGPVIWSVGDVRLVTDNAAMMVHSMAVSDPSTKATSHIVDMGDFISMVTEKFLRETVGKIGLATEEEIRTIVSTSKEYYHGVKEVISRTNAGLVHSDDDIWEHITEGYDHV